MDAPLNPPFAPSFPTSLAPPSGRPCPLPSNPASLPPSSPPQACSSYEAAVAACPPSHASLYNWGVALSDLARVLKATAAAQQQQQQQQVASPAAVSAVPVGSGRPHASTGAAAVSSAASAAAAAAVAAASHAGGPSQLASGSGASATSSAAATLAEARRCLSLASEKYAEAVRLHPNNPQALNNWGLVLQVRCGGGGGGLPGAGVGPGSMAGCSTAWCGGVHRCSAGTWNMKAEIWTLNPNPEP